MKLSFAPAKLDLQSEEDGSLRLTIEGHEILHTRSMKAAVAKFNAVRKELESRFPPHELTAEHRAEALREMLKDAQVQHNSIREKKKKASAGGTRTFGG